MRSGTAVPGRARSRAAAAGVRARANQTDRSRPAAAAVPLARPACAESGTLTTNWRQGGGQEEAEGEGRERGKNALAKRRIKRRALQPKWTRWHWEKTETGLQCQTAQLHDVQT